MADGDGLCDLTPHMVIRIDTSIIRTEGFIEKRWQQKVTMKRSPKLN